MNAKLTIFCLLYISALACKAPKIDPKIIHEQRLKMNNFLQRSVDEERSVEFPEGLPFNLLKEYYLVKNKEGVTWQMRPLDVALEFDNPLLLEELLKKNIEQAVFISRPMMLFNAIDRNKNNCALYLIKHGDLNLNATDFQGRTPLMFAVSKNYKIAKALVKAGVRLDIKDSYGKTVLDYADNKCRTKLLNYKQKNTTTI